MKIVGFHINKLLVERKNPIKGKLSIKSKLNIEDITGEENSAKMPAFRFNFVYNIDYEPSISKIELKGSVIAIDDKGEGKDILKDWKDKKFLSPLKVPLFNFIMNKCTIKAIELEEEIGLPVHIPLPKIKSKQSGKVVQSSNPANYTG